jgi:acid phosphatase type 7
MRCSQCLALVILLVGLACSRSQSPVQKDIQAQPSAQPVELHLQLSVPFHFVAYGDSRFHDVKDTENANPAARLALVQAIAGVNPAFISFGGDIVYNGNDVNDWKTYDTETAVWRAKGIPVYPALGNHDLEGDQRIALANYFARFPELKDSRYYSVRLAIILLLVLDSSVDETSGAQGKWLTEKLDTLPADVDFLVFVFHHPPYTSSSNSKKSGGGHSARPQEQVLAKMLEARQANMRARIVVFSGHVHNYERYEHRGVHYFVTGGAGAHAYPIERAPDDLFQSDQINYHYLMVDVERGDLKVTMNRLDLSSGKPVWTQPDKVEIPVPAAKAATQPRAASSAPPH